MGLLNGKGAGLTNDENGLLGELSWCKGATFITFSGIYVTWVWLRHLK